MERIPRVNEVTASQQRLQISALQPLIVDVSSLEQTSDAELLARAADDEDLIVLTSLRLAGGIQKKRLRKRHEQLLFERLRIQKEIENVLKQFDLSTRAI